MGASGYLFIHKDQATVFVIGVDEDKAREQVHELLPLAYATAGHTEETINEDDLVCCPVFEHEGMVGVAWAPMAREPV